MHSPRLLDFLARYFAQPCELYRRGDWQWVNVQPRDPNPPFTQVSDVMLGLGPISVLTLDMLPAELAPTTHVRVPTTCPIQYPFQTHFCDSIAKLTPLDAGAKAGHNLRGYSAFQLELS